MSTLGQTQSLATSQPVIREQQVIFNDGQEAFNTFMRSTNQKPNINGWLNRRCPAKEGMKILSIGAGTGEEMLGYLNGLRGRGVNFRIDYLDPSQELFKTFSESMRRNGLQDRIGGPFHCTFENFTTTEKYDLIIASHVFYYIDKKDDSLKKLWSFLKPDGKALIFLQSRESDNYRFRETFLPRINGKSYVEANGNELANIASTLEMDSLTNIGRSILDFQGEMMESRLNMSHVVGPMEPDREGKLLLTFMLRTNFENLDGNLKTDIMQYIRNVTTRNMGPHFRLLDTVITVEGLTKQRSLQTPPIRPTSPTTKPAALTMGRTPPSSSQVLPSF